jgi:Ser/Thr protein kinase RdoA (MazF antagonist)
MPLLSHQDYLNALQTIAEAALAHYELPADAKPRMINLSENATYRVEDPLAGRSWALRVHRESYHSRTAIASELAWLMALRNDGAAITPKPVSGRDGEFIQLVATAALSSPRHVVLFDWESGVEPKENDAAGFEILGETTARMHAHARSWRRPPQFQRHTWDFETSLGAKPHWGSWRNGKAMTAERERLFGRTVEAIRQRLARFGTERGRFGLIHCDMRLANLLIDGPVVKVIDFDDCGFGWLLYDCATTVSFLEHKPEAAKLLGAWVRGYRKLLDLSPEDEAEIPTFVMLRRLVLLAWIGSHAETDLAKSMGTQYTEDTSRLCQQYLDTLGSVAA